LRNDYFDSDEFREILDVYEDSLKTGITPYLDIDDYSDIADYYMNSDNSSEAIRCVESGLNIYPDEPVLLLIKSGAYIYLHRFEEAEEIVESLSAAGNNEVAYQKAQLQYALHDNTEKAEEMFAAWLADERENAFNDEEDAEQREEYIRDNYIHVITSLIELAPGHVYDEEVVKRWVELYIVNFSPLGNYDSDLILADTVRSECLYDMVIRVYGNLLETNPYLSHGWTILSAAQFTCNQVDEALDSVEFALAIDPEDTDAMLTKAHCLMFRENYADAAPILEEYVKRTHDGSQQLALATCYVENENTTAALRCLQKAEIFFTRYSSDKDYYASACFEMADLYFALNRLDRARKYIDRAVRLSPDEIEFNLLNATLKLAEDKFDEALPLFISYIQNQDDVVNAVVKIATRLIVFNLDPVALELLDIIERTSVNYEGTENIYPYKALIYLRRKDYKLAAQYMKLGELHCPELTQWVLSDNIPVGMSLSRYCEIISKRK